jgi:hypothetical protein
MPSEDDYLKVLVDYFTQYIDDNFDIYLSREYMKFLTPLISHYSIAEFDEQLSDFVRVYKDRWLNAVKSLRIMESRDYLIQPELLLMFYLLDKNKYVLIDLLDSEIPLSDVDEICIYWGIPADDYRA